MAAPPRLVVGREVDDTPAAEAPTALGVCTLLFDPFLVGDLQRLFGPLTLLPGQTSTRTMLWMLVQSLLHQLPMSRSNRGFGIEDPRRGWLAGPRLHRLLGAEGT